MHFGGYALFWEYAFIIWRNGSNAASVSNPSARIKRMVPKYNPLENIAYWMITLAALVMGPLMVRIGFIKSPLVIIGGILVTAIGTGAAMDLLETKKGKI
jgi:hypothetical protein